MILDNQETKAKSALRYHSNCRCVIASATLRICSLKTNAVHHNVGKSSEPTKETIFCSVGRSGMTFALL